MCQEPRARVQCYCAHHAYATRTNLTSLFPIFIHYSSFHSCSVTPVIETLGPYI